MSRTNQLGFILLLLIGMVLNSCNSLNSEPEYTLNVTVEPSEAGTVSEVQAERIGRAEVIELTAQPNEHWVFAEWMGDHSDTGQQTLVFMSKDKNVTARFQKRDYPLTLTIEGEGNVLEEVIPQKTTTSEYPHATMLRLTAEPVNGWEFIEWQGGAEGTDPQVEIEIGGPVEVTAVFGRIDYKLIVNVEGGGDVEQEIIQPKVTEDEYPFETMVQLTGVSEYGWQFGNWSGDAEGTDSVTVVEILGQKEVTAHFDRIIYSVDIEVEGEGSIQKRVDGEVTDSSNFPFETELELISQPANGWEIEEWIVNGESISRDANITIPVEGNTEILARFQLIQYEINVTVTGQGSYQRKLDGQPTSQTSYTYGMILELEATPQNNWSFAGWTGDVSSTNPTIAIFIDEDRDIVLDFLPFVPNSRILMLGDSITNGFPFTYRFNFHNLMKNKALQFQFVGTQNSNPANYPGIWDKNHEGYNGASTNFINQELSGWLNNYTADMALIYLGIIDIINYSSDNKPVSALDASIDNMLSIIDQLRLSNPNIKIYIATIMPISLESISPEVTESMVLTWNQKLIAMAGNKNSIQSPIRIVDMFNGFSLADLYDGIHPYKSTSERMGQRWFDAITAF